MKDLKKYIDTMIPKVIKAYQFQIMDKNDAYVSPVLNAIMYEHDGPDGEKGLEVVCLEFGMSAWAEDQDTASRALNQLCMVYIKRLLENKDADNLFYDDIISDSMEHLWVLHRVLLSMRKVSIQEDRPDLFEDMISKLLLENKELKSKLKQNTDRFNISNVFYLKKQFSTSKPSVQYQDAL